MPGLYSTTGRSNFPDGSPNKPRYKSRKVKTRPMNLADIQEAAEENCSCQTEDERQMRKKRERERKSIGVISLLSPNYGNIARSVGVKSRGSASFLPPLVSASRRGCGKSNRVAAVTGGGRQLQLLRVLRASKPVVRCEVIISQTGLKTHKQNK